MELVPGTCLEKQRCIYDGYNVADALGFVNLEMYNHVWQVNVQMKHDIYSTNMVTLKDVDDQDAGPTPDNAGLQPMFYHQLPPGLHLEVILSFNVVVVLGLDNWMGAN